MGHFLTGRPGAVNFRVSSLPDDTEVRIHWVPPTEQTTIITSYQVIYSLYEAASNIQSVTLNGSSTSYVIENLSK